MSINILIRKLSKVTPVTIEYSDLVSGKDITKLITEAYSNNGLGVLAVSNVTGYSEKRKKLLPLARELALLPDSDKKEIEFPQDKFSTGWSHGKEHFLGEPDYSKGSFYANPELDSPLEPGEWPDNLWPVRSLRPLERAFKDLGQEIIRVGILLGEHLDRYIEARYPTYVKGTISNIIKYHKSHVGRLLHYFPQTESKNPWCGWHNDHCLLTGLTSSMYLNQKTGEIVSPSELADQKIGLFIRNRNKEICKIAVGENDLMFQLGESSQILSGGSLQATPHSVLTDGTLENVSRNTFALFMEPRQKYEMVSVDSARVYIEHAGIPSLKSRWSPGTTFGQFHEKTIKAFN